jgi:hypothetical protein
MVKRKLFYAVPAWLVPVMCVMIISCAVNGKLFTPVKENKTVTAVADYSGIYEITDPSVCSLTITISKNNMGYVYTLNAAGVRSTGKLKVEKEGEEIYLDFTATLRSGDKTSVTGMYSDNSIMIQNYGNAMNPYTCFKECDVKYLQLLKVE